MSRLNREIAAGAKLLVEGDANARRKTVAASPRLVPRRVRNRGGGSRPAFPPLTTLSIEALTLASGGLLLKNSLNTYGPALAASGSNRRNLTRRSLRSAGSAGNSSDGWRQAAGPFGAAGKYLSASKNLLLCTSLRTRQRAAQNTIEYKCINMTDLRCYFLCCRGEQGL
jgi:hypothetical protein